MSEKELFACPAEGCEREFDTERGLSVHMRVHEDMVEDLKENPKPPLKEGKKKRWITETMYVI